ncbi:MAG TPA: PVC-type heme-binding CxxCH protein [Tepidisphaeraceae bacterium]|nr:PVC-type heme-binding CxxCH protein [Tepidisphaeraceae bacterium]
MIARLLSVVLVTFCLATSTFAIPASEGSTPAQPDPSPLEVPDIPPAFELATKQISRLMLAPGLSAEVFAAEPQLTNPVAMCTDEKGRFWVVETFRFDGGGVGHGTYDIRHRYHLLDEDLASKTVEQRLEMIKRWNNNDLSSLTQFPDRLRLIEDTDGDGRADRSTIYDDSFNHPLDGVASGVLVRGDDVYFANVPHLWLLKDTNGDNKAEVRERLLSGFGVRYSLLGHDLHGLRFGPDGKLYFSMGDRGLHVTTKEGKLIDLPDEGAVLRCEPDGSDLEVFATGLRNPQKLVFDDYGNLFTGDNNCDHGDPARWVYIVEGGDTGWRIGYQHIMTPKATGPWLAEGLTNLEENNTAAYVIPPIAHIAGGPSGCTYYPGTSLPERYNDHFFLTDFRAGPHSPVWSFAMKPKGARFELVDRHEFIKGLVPTDIEFGIDGGAYITDWMGNFSKQQKGRIIRIFDPASATSAIVLETKKLIQEGMSKRGEPELIRLLAHADQRVRQAAQFELAGRGSSSVKALTALALQGDHQLARIHGVWALGQIARKQTGALEPLIPLLGDADDEIRAQAAKVLGEHRVAGAYHELIKLLGDAQPRVRFFAAMALGKIGKADAIQPLLRMLAENDNKDAFLRHAGVMGLAWIGDTSALLEAAEDGSPAARIGLVLALRHQKHADIARFLKDADPAIVLEAARAINDLPLEQANPDLARLINTSGMAQPLAHRVLNANFRLGGAGHANAVAAHALSSGSLDVMRIEALQMLNEWGQPRGINRVTGNWQPYNPARDGAAADAASRKVLGEILRTAPDAVRAAAIALAERVGTDDPDALFDTVANAKASGEVRAAALRAMAARKDPRVQEAAVVGLASGHGPLRSESIRQQAGLPDAVERFEKLLAGDDLADKQAVLSTLGNVQGKAVDAILIAWMDKLLAGEVPLELQLDLLEAAGRSKSAAVQEKVKAYEAVRPKDDVLAPFREALAGGDAKAGREIFMKRQDVSCLRCHKIGAEGGTMGPEITGIGARHDRLYLLESIVAPNKHIAPGFEASTIRLKNGTVHNGIVKGETETELQMEIETGPIMLKKDEITLRRAAPSPMPDDIAQPLSKRDLRNLVEFLATQK